MTDEIEKIETKQEKNRGFARAISILFSVGIIITLILIKKSNPEFPIWIVFAVSGFLLIVVLITFFWLNISRKLKLFKQEKESEDKIPIAKTIIELKEIIKNLIEDENSYMNHIRSWGKLTSQDIGKNLIYNFEIELEYPDNKLGKHILFIINANYPTRFDILSQTEEKREITKLTNKKSTNPEEDPDSEKRTELDLSTGKQTIYERKTKKRKDKTVNTKKEDVVA